jgi:hypothetical protein
MRDSAVVILQISSVVLFVIIFLYTLDGTITQNYLILLDLILVLSGFTVRFFTDSAFDGKEIEFENFSNVLREKYF